MTETSESQNTQGVDIPAVESEIKIEVSWESVLPVVQSLMQKNEVVAQLGQLLVEAESKKDAIKEHIVQANETLRISIEKVKKDHDISDDPSWELDLPDKEGDSAFFVKKTQ